jgi:hypothetical protein
VKGAALDCPWCDVKAGPRALHAHLGEQHGEHVATSERNGKVFYQVICPACGTRYEHLVRKAARDPEFLAGFGREIRMVALDMLVHHLMAEHGGQDPGGSGTPGASAPGMPARPATGE